MAPKRTQGGAPASPASASPSVGWSVTTGPAGSAPSSGTPGTPGVPTRLTVGLVRGVRGLKGHVRVELLTDRPEDRFAVGSRLFVEGTPRVLTVAESAAVADGPGWWLRFREIPSREAADTLRDLYLEIEPPAEPREPGQWFFHELIGLAVRSTEGEDLGTVKDIYRAGGAEVFVVRGPRGEIDVPGVKGVVTDLAPERGELIVDMAVLDVDARPVDDEDYVRPRDRRPRKQVKPKGPAQPPKGTPNEKAGEAAAPKAPKASKAQKAATGSAPKGGKASGTYTLSPDEIAQAMSAAGKPVPAIVRSDTPEPPSD